MNIADDKYYEIKAILKEEHSNSPAVMILKERYATGSIDSAKFIKIRNEITLDFS